MTDRPRRRDGTRGLLPLLLLGALLISAAVALGHPSGADPDELDHAAVLRSLNEATLEKGKRVYEGYCAACHGYDGRALLPTARSFDRDSLKYGADPYSMWLTITEGRGMMASHAWIPAEERYYVVQYIRERFIKTGNPDQYVEITDAYLDTLPKPAGDASDQDSASEQDGSR